MYDKGERTLRAEVVVHNTKDLKCKREIDSFGEIVEKLKIIMGSFLSNLDYAHVATISEKGLEELSSPSQAGVNRLAGIDFNKARTKQVGLVLLALSMKPGGFTSKELAVEMSNKFIPDYSCRNASYDIKKFRGKALVIRVHKRIKYQLTEEGIKTIAAILCVMTKELPPILSVITSPWKEQKKEQLLQMDKYLFVVHEKCEQIRTLQNMKLTA